MSGQPEDATLQHIIHELEPENTLGVLLTVQMGGTPEEVQLLLQTAAYDAEQKTLKPTGTFIIRCVGVREHRVSVGLFNRMVYVEDHPLLWNHNYSYRQLYFRGAPDNVDVLMLELNQLYGQTYGPVRPLADDLNRALPLETLLKSGHGLLGEMPAPMAGKVQLLLERHGLSVSLVAADQDSPPFKHKLLAMDDSFVVAQLYSSDPIESRTMQ